MTLQCALMIAITLYVSTPARGQYTAKSAPTNWNAFMIVHGESTHDGRVVFCESPDAPILTGRGYNSGSVGANASTTQFTLHYRVESQ